MQARQKKTAQHGLALGYVFAAMQEHESLEMRKGTVRDAET